MNPDAVAGLLLAVAGAVCGAGTLLAMRRFSDQAALRTAKARVRAHLYEMRLFGDDPVLALRAQRKLLLWNLRYVKLALLPAAVVALPAILALSQLEALFGHRALAPGESATVTVRTTAASPSLIAPPGFAIETPPVRLAEAREVCWRIRALRASDGPLRLRSNGQETARRVHAGTGLRAVTPVCSSATLARIIHGCALEGAGVEFIAVDYPGREIALFGFQAHWLIWLSLFWLAAMLLLKRQFRVTF